MIETLADVVEATEDCSIFDNPIVGVVDLDIRTRAPHKSPLFRGPNDQTSSIAYKMLLPAER